MPNTRSNPSRAQCVIACRLAQAKLAAAHMAARIPGAGPAQTIAGASHFLQEEKGEEIADRILRFLADA